MQLFDEMNASRKRSYQIERESRANSRLGRSPASKTKIWKYHVSRHSVTADAAEILKNPYKPINTSHVNPCHVRLHLLLFTMYTYWPIMIIHHDRLSTNDAPNSPNPISYTATQLIPMWTPASPLICTH